MQWGGIKGGVWSLRDVFTEAEFDFVPVVLLARRSDDRQDLEVRKFFLDLGERIVDDVLLELQLIPIAQHLPFTSAAAYFPRLIVRFIRRQ